jgi:hypothetical protein
MKALCVTERRELEVRHVPTPMDLPSDHVLVDIEASAINHGDKAFLARPNTAAGLDKYVENAATKSSKTSRGYRYTLQQFYSCTDNSLLSSVTTRQLYDFAAHLCREGLGDRTLCAGGPGTVDSVLLFEFFLCTGAREQEVMYAGGTTSISSMVYLRCEPKQTGRRRTC